MRIGRIVGTLLEDDRLNGLLDRLLHSGKDISMSWSLFRITVRAWLCLMLHLTYDSI